ncbi:MAG: Eco57I restriction-modification methylase domain-containing protein [Bacteroidales bacterium]|nr:Eco57I restriction-modification methylase domain-containing protein [Bacteroidales bacterium]
MLEIETERKKLQEHLDSLKSQRERNVMGQFSTPYPLAEDIMRYLKSLVGTEETSLFEPSIGTGVFYSAFADTFGIGSKALGIEIDSHYYAPSSDLWRNYPLEIRHEDFFTARPDRQFPLIVANPPYVRHHHIGKELKQRLQALSLQRTGVIMSGLSGLYCYFLILSEVWLQPGGISCWLIPSEFMDVNYGKALKQYLLENVDLIRIHRFQADDLQFSDALVSSCVVVFRKAEPNRETEIVFSLGGSLCKPTRSKHIKRDEIHAAQKWTGLFDDEFQEETCTDILGNYFTVKRGIVTGGNDFFIVDQSTIDKYGIDKLFLRPILPSPRYISGNVVEEVKGGMPDTEQQCFLFSCNLQENILKKSYPGTWEYICHGISQGVPKGYVCSRRTPWYSCEDRLPASIVVPYMGRSGTGNRMFRFILNKSKALTTNVYLLLYPKPQYEKLLSDQDVLLQVWKALNTIPPDRIARGGRFYGGGLRKMEPNELMSIPAGELNNLLRGPSYGVQLSISGV